MLHIICPCVDIRRRLAYFDWVNWVMDYKVLRKWYAALRCQNFVCHSAYRVWLQRSALQFSRRVASVLFRQRTRRRRLWISTNTLLLRRTYRSCKSCFARSATTRRLQSWPKCVTRCEVTAVALQLRRYMPAFCGNVWKRNGMGEHWAVYSKYSCSFYRSVQNRQSNFFNTRR